MTEITPSDLIEEAKRDVNAAKRRMVLFNIWSMGENATEEERERVANYKPHVISLKKTSAAAGAFAAKRIW